MAKLETVDSIVKNVERSLASDAGRARVERMLDWARVLVERQPSFPSRKPLYARRGTKLYIEPSAVYNDIFKMSLRVHGVKCAIIKMHDGQATLSVPKAFSSKFTSLTQVPRTPVPWQSDEASQYVKAAVVVADREFGNRESAVESATIELMKGDKVLRKSQLRRLQPVTLGGLPLQIPSPVAPRGSSLAASGHIDILARAERGELRVFEIKRPKVADSPHALGQAVHYVAALHHMMSEKTHRELLWRAFDSRSGSIPRIGAVAFVSCSDGQLGRLKIARDQLRSRDSLGLKLTIMSYRWQKKIGGQRTLQVEGTSE